LRSALRVARLLIFAYPTNEGTTQKFASLNRGVKVKAKTYTQQVFLLGGPLAKRTQWIVSGACAAFSLFVKQSY